MFWIKVLFLHLQQATQPEPHYFSLSKFTESSVPSYQNSATGKRMGMLIIRNPNVVCHISI